MTNPDTHPQPAQSLGRTVSYTPGPWKYDKESGYIETDESLIASVNELENPNENGKLISAAPCLLESLTKCVVALEAIIDDPVVPLPIWKNVVLESRKVIAKTIPNA